jgi:hypothetical protein
MTKEQEIERGRRAAEMVDSDIFKAAVAELESTYIREWQNTAAADVAGRERLFIALQVQRDFVQHFQSMIVAGKISAQAAQKIRTAK